MRIDAVSQDLVCTKMQTVFNCLGADRPGSLTGLLSRMSMYLGFYTPLVPKIYAYLRVKKTTCSFARSKDIKRFCWEYIQC